MKDYITYQEKTKYNRVSNEEKLDAERYLKELKEND